MIQLTHHFPMGFKIKPMNYVICHIMDVQECVKMDMVSHFTKMVISKHKQMIKLKIKNNVNLNHLCGKHIS